MPDNDVLLAPTEFRHSILALLTETDWLTRYGCILLPEYFPTTEEQRYVNWVNSYYETYHKLPSHVALQHGVQDAPELVNDVIRVKNAAIEYAADVAMDFARTQAMKIAILQSVDDIKAGDLHKPLERVKLAQRVGLDRTDLGMELIDDMDKWVGEELHGQRYPTGWSRVDNILGGGLVAGELGFVMAPPGMGKTTMLVNVGYGMAGLLGHTNVLHVTLEVGVEQLLARYAARVAGVRLNREEDSMSEAQFKETLKQRGKQRLRGRLRAVAEKWTVSSISATIDNLASDGFQVGALIVDYPDLMESGRRRDEKRFELADICRDLRKLGIEYQIPVWGASQSTRDSFYKEEIGMANIAEAIEKAAVVDVLISLNQTKEEEQLNQGRLYMAKVRRKKSHDFIPVKIDFENQAITVKMSGSRTK